MLAELHADKNNLTAVPGLRFLKSQLDLECRSGRCHGVLRSITRRHCCRRGGSGSGGSVVVLVVVAVVVVAPAVVVEVVVSRQRW